MEIITNDWKLTLFKKCPECTGPNSRSKFGYCDECNSKGVITDVITLDQLKLILKDSDK